MAKRKPADEKLTWAQIDRLARHLAVDLMGASSETLCLLLILLHEIGVHSFDQSHVESIVCLVRDHLFMVTRESDEREQELIAKSRAEWMEIIG